MRVSFWNLCFSFKHSFFLSIGRWALFEFSIVGSGSVWSIFWGAFTEVSKLLCAVVLLFNKVKKIYNQNNYHTKLKEGASMKSVRIDCTNEQATCFGGDEVKSCFRYEKISFSFPLSQLIYDFLCRGIEHRKWNLVFVQH